MLLVAARRYRSRAVALILGSILAVLAFQTGIHSAHHLGSEDDGAACAVASATGHLAWASAEAATAARVGLRPSGRAVVDDRWTLERRLLAAPPGRAPPLAA